MSTTTGVVQHRNSWYSGYRRHGYFFREAAMITIGMGVILHLDRVLLGDARALHHLVTVGSDRVLLIPMTYAAIAGILVWRQARFATKHGRAVFTASVVYIAASVPLHVYMSYISMNIALVMWFPMWFSYLLLIVVYPVFLMTFWRLRYETANKVD